MQGALFFRSWSFLISTCSISTCTHSARSTKVGPSLAEVNVCWSNEWMSSTNCNFLSTFNMYERKALMKQNYPIEWKCMSFIFNRGDHCNSTYIFHVWFIFKVIRQSQIVHSFCWFTLFCGGQGEGEWAVLPYKIIY